MISALSFLKGVGLMALALVVLLLLGACSTDLRMKGAALADTALETSVWGVCEAATIGAVRRGFSGDEAAYQAFCEAAR
jgi:hypothetical protein